MKSAGEILRELGFNKDASEGAQKAFIKNLIQAAAACDNRSSSNNQGVSPSFEITAPTTVPTQQSPVQLSFEFDYGKKVS